MRERADEQGRDRIDEALEPPNRVNPITGLPYGWDTDDNDLDTLIGYA